MAFGDFMHIKTNSTAALTAFAVCAKACAGSATEAATAQCSEPLSTKLTLLDRSVQANNQGHQLATNLQSEGLITLQHCAN
jgi:hypothetical protein